MQSFSQTTITQFLEPKVTGSGSGALYVVADDGRVIVNSDSETVPATPTSAVLSPPSRHLPATNHRELTEILRLQLRMPLLCPVIRLLNTLHLALGVPLHQGAGPRVLSDYEHR